jgi:oligopeptide transport system substrate-binding protein
MVLIAVKFLFSINIMFHALAKSADVTSFGFHSVSTTESPDPIRNQYSVSSYLLNVLYAPLMRYQDGVLKPYAAKSCTAITLKHYRCELRPDWKWSDGDLVTAQQIIEGYKALRAEASPRLDNFLNIEKIKNVKSNLLDFYLKKADSDFLYRLIDPALGPRRQDVMTGELTYGPYFISIKHPGRSYLFSPNPHFYIKNPNRPKLEMFFVESHEAALRMYEVGQLHFLRQLIAENFVLYKNSPEFYQRSLHRMDYIGFGAELSPYPELRDRLIHSLNPQYDQFVKLFDALGRPGCFGLSSSAVSKILCYDQNKKVPAYSQQEILAFPKLNLHYSLMGGEDIRRAMELFQNGWKTQLQLEVELKPAEQGIMTQLLKTNPPTLFRRGIPLDRPTCLAALEVFKPKNPDNYLKIDDAKLNQIINELEQLSAKAKVQKYDQLCQAGLKRLLELKRIIPLGPMHFTMLKSPKFKGIKINELNQIDLSELRPVLR